MVAFKWQPLLTWPFLFISYRVSWVECAITKLLSQFLQPFHNYFRFWKKGARISNGIKIILKVFPPITNSLFRWQKVTPGITWLSSITYIVRNDAACRTCYTLYILVNMQYYVEEKHFPSYIDLYLFLSLRVQAFMHDSHFVL